MQVRERELKTEPFSENWRVKLEKNSAQDRRCEVVGSSVPPEIHLRNLRYMRIYSGELPGAEEIVINGLRGSLKQKYARLRNLEFNVDTAVTGRKDDIAFCSGFRSVATKW